MPGVGVHNQNYRTRFENVSVEYFLLAADASDPVLIAAKAGYTIYVQAIIVNVTTDNAAQLTFRSATTTTRIIHITPASPGLGTFDSSVDFGPEGISLVEGEGLEMVTSAAGLAAAIIVYAYRRPTAVVAA